MLYIWWYRRVLTFFHLDLSKMSEFDEVPARGVTVRDVTPADFIKWCREKDEIEVNIEQQLNLESMGIASRKDKCWLCTSSVRKKTVNTCLIRNRRNCELIGIFKNSYISTTAHIYLEVAASSPNLLICTNQSTVLHQVLFIYLESAIDSLSKAIPIACKPLST